MSAVLENIWPIHGAVWVFCAFTGLVLGTVLANATGSAIVNVLILLGILLSMTFALSQGVGMALALRAEDFQSWGGAADFWIRSQDMAWIYNGQFREVAISTAIGTLTCALCGFLMLAARRETN